MLKYLFSNVVVMCILLPLFGQENRQLLYYVKPAEAWTEALPIGNGLMGAMVYGNAKQEHLQLNEATLYSGDPQTNFRGQNVRKRYNELVELMDEGKYAEAQTFVQKNWLGRAQECYQPMGDLYMNLHEGEKIDSFKRYLDISNAVAGIDYKIDNTKFTREIFASYPDKIIAIKMEADGKLGITGNIYFDTPHKPTKKVYFENGDYVLEGRAPGLALRRTLEMVEDIGDQHKYPELFNLDGSRKAHAKQILYGEEAGGLGMFFQSRLRWIYEGGSVTMDGDKLVLKDVKLMVLYLTYATSYTDFKTSPVLQPDLPKSKTLAALDGLKNLPYTNIKNRHVIDYRQLFDRVVFKLSDMTSQSKLPTEERISKYAYGGDEDLVTLLFQFGRYLMISGSRPGGQPLNLQGIWNDMIIPPWASSYTTNINLEMNYWPAELTNLSECTEPLFTSIKELAVNGKEAAYRIYGNNGWMGNHNMSIWRQADPIDRCPCSYWPMVAGWLTSHFWEHYLFSGDKVFLREEVFPLLKGAVLFYKDWLMANKDGYLVTPVGHSPEQTFIYGDRKESTLSPGPTMDMALIRESFTRYLEALNILKIQDDQYQSEIKSKLDQLLPYQIGKHGQLQEWEKDFDDKDVHHRHVSHLYPFYPGNQITPNTSETLTSAVRRVLERRGDYATGWSMGWKVNLWARMYDGDKALQILSKLLRLVKENDPNFSGSGSYPNLFDAHPPFQIDGNFGATAGIVEMLLQSHDGYVHLLPALPNKWQQGFISGIKSRGGFEVEMQWQNSILNKGKIKSHAGGVLPIKSSIPLKISGGKVLAQSQENHLLKPIAIIEYLNVNKVQYAPMNFPKFYTYTIATEIGEVITMEAAVQKKTKR